jgi:hypothetical protein
MDAQDIRNLSEAYMEVYDNEMDEAYDPKGQYKLTKKMSSLAKPDPDSTQAQNQKRKDRSNKMYDKHYTSYVRPKSMPDGYGGPEWKSRKNKEKTNEDYDLYDIILSHLIDEGYAETPEAAEAIMVNMSEDWRESIVEAEIEPPKEKVGALTNIDIPMSEREAARQRTLAKAKAMREKKKN